MEVGTYRGDSFLKHGRRAIFHDSVAAQVGCIRGLVGYNRAPLGVSQTIPAVPSLNLDHYFFIDMFGEVNNLLPLENNDAFEAGSPPITNGLV